LPNHAADILGYAARHDYPDILDIAAPLVVHKECLSETLPKLPQEIILRWVRSNINTLVRMIMMFFQVKYFEVVHRKRREEGDLEIPGFCLTSPQYSGVPNPALPTFSTFN
jgi:hypothetical protein